MPRRVSRIQAVLRKGSKPCYVELTQNLDFETKASSGDEESFQPSKKYSRKAGRVLVAVPGLAIRKIIQSLFSLSLPPVKLKLAPEHAQHIFRGELGRIVKNDARPQIASNEYPCTGPLKAHLQAPTSTKRGTL